MITSLGPSAGLLQATLTLPASLRATADTAVSEGWGGMARGPVKGTTSKQGYITVYAYKLYASIIRSKMNKIYSFL